MTDLELRKIILAKFYYKNGEIFRRHNYLRFLAHKRVGWVCKKGYGYFTIGKISGERITLGIHRAVFLIKRGFLPEVVDHIDRNPRNNNISNLRDATKRQNSFNRKRHKNNTSGTRGVTYCKRDKVWIASISNEGFKRKVVGRFKDKTLAVSARQIAEKQHYGEFKAT